MKILGLEAAAKVAGVALLEDGAVRSEESLATGLTHSQTLLPMVDRVLRAAETDISEIDVVALTNGPGSFTGLRIAAAAAKGLILPNEDARIMPICTLESLAYNVRGVAGLVVPIMDARRSQVYGAVYRDGVCILSPAALPPAELLAFLQTQGEEVCTFLGDASLLYKDFFAEGLGARYRLANPVQRQLSAASTAALAWEKMQAGVEPVTGPALSIDYLRKPQAERIRLGEE